MSRRGFRSMRTHYGLKRMKKSGEAAKPKTARQYRMASNFSFLESHMTVRTQISQLWLTVPAPAPGVDEEEDAVSVTFHLL